MRRSSTPVGTPDMVVTGHVHNYQRFTRTVHGDEGGDEKEVPYVVAGAGGFWHLQAMQRQPDGSPVMRPLLLARVFGSSPIAIASTRS